MNKPNKNKNKRYDTKEGWLIPLTIFLVFDAVFSLLFYFYKKENLIRTDNDYDYILYGTLAALAFFIVPMIKALLNYFIRKEFED